jgi:hypothetical protein
VAGQSGRPGSEKLLTGSYFMHQRCFSNPQFLLKTPKLGTPTMVVRAVADPLVVVGRVTPANQGCKGPRLVTCVLLL